MGSFGTPPLLFNTPLTKPLHLTKLCLTLPGIEVRHESRPQPPPAPDFEMADSEGKVVRLSDFKGKKHVVLVFNRGFS